MGHFIAVSANFLLCSVSLELSLMTSRKFLPLLNTGQLFWRMTAGLIKAKNRCKFCSCGRQWKLASGPDVKQIIRRVGTGLMLQGISTVTTLWKTSDQSSAACRKTSGCSFCCMFWPGLYGQFLDLFCSFSKI